MENNRYPVEINNNDQFINYPYAYEDNYEINLKQNKTIKDTLNMWEAVWDNLDIDVHFHIYGVAQSNGHHMITSRVIKIENGKAYTRNSVYQLGFPRYSYMNKVVEENREITRRQDRYE